MAIDHNFSDVKLLLHFDGADASTTFTDNSPSAHTITPSGNAQIDTAFSKFGGASGLFDGTGDYLSTPVSADFNFGTGDFTIEFWLRTTNTPTGFQRILAPATSTNTAGGLQIWYPPDTSLGDTPYAVALAAPSGGTIVVSTKTSCKDGNWHHIAFTRASGTAYAFFDGVLKHSAADSNNYTLAGTQGFKIAARADLGAANYFNGALDDLRITKGVARYTSSFTVPAEAFPNTGGIAVTGTTGALTLTGYAATSNHIDTVNRVTGQTGTLTLIGVAGLFSKDISAIGSQGTLTLTGYAGVYNNTPVPQFAAFTTQSSLLAYVPQTAEFTAQSALAVYRIYTGTFTSVSSLNAYQPQATAFNAQSALTAYSAMQGDFSSQSANSIYHSGQVSFIAQATLNSYLSQQATFNAQTALTELYRTYAADFNAQSHLNAYAVWQTEFISQSTNAVYAPRQCVFNTESALTAFSVWLSRFTATSTLNAYQPSQTSFISQSAVTTYLAQRALYNSQSALNRYQASQGRFNQQSALNAYTVQASVFVSQSELTAYAVTLAAFTAQSALDATEKFYAWALNLTTGAISKFDNYSFNALSGLLGSDAVGIHTLTGTTDNGTAIAGFIETGLLDFKESALKRLTDAYIGVNGGVLKLSVTADNSSSIAYTLAATTKPKTVKANLARGAKGRYWKVKLENVSGSVAVVDAIELEVQKLSRRV